MRPKVLVSHPNKIYVHQMAYALQEGGYLEKFIASLWFKPDTFPFSLISSLPPRWRNTLEREFKKRYFENIDEDFIEQFPFYELFREGLDRLLKGYKNELGIYLGNQVFDWYVAKRVEKLKPDIVSGYETSSLRTFNKAKGLNLITVLDLTQVHYGFIEELKRRYPEYGRTFDNKVSKEVNTIKEQTLRKSDYIIAISDLVKGTLINKGFPEDKIYLANPGFAPERFRPKKSYRKDGNFKILYVGAITTRKGIRLALEAYRQLGLKNSELILIGGMTGDSDFLKEYRGLYTYIHYLHHDELVSYYQDADVFVFPSYLDSWGMAVVEAMGCGTPVIVSENSGAKEAVSDGSNGFIIPAADVGALKEKILFLYNNRDKLECLGRNAREQAETYTWENYRKRVRKIILEIWDKSTSQRRVMNQK